MNRRRAFLAAAALLLLGLVAWWLWPQRAREPIWAPARHEYRPGRCADGGCEQLLTIPLPGAQGFALYYDPKVDDAVAQWGRCLEEIVACVEHNEGAAAAYPACVAASGCPAACRDAFARRAAGAETAEAMIAAVEAVFLAPAALCNPGPEPAATGRKGR